MRMRRMLPLAVALGLLAVAVPGCGPYGSTGVYVGVAVPGPYVGYPYPYRGPYGGWVGRPYPSPYPRYDDAPASALESAGLDPAQSDTLVASDTAATAPRF